MIVPGVLLTFLLMLTTYVVAKKRGYKPHTTEKPTLKQIINSMRDSKWALLFPIILIVTIRFGIFTPSEAGAFAVVYATLVGMFAYKSLSFSDIKVALHESVGDIGMIMLIILSSGMIGYMFAYEQLPVELATTISAITSNPSLVLFLCLALLLAVGMLMEGTVTVLLLTPILVPMIQMVGIDPVHFGILMLIMVSFGGTTPPVGIAMYTVCGILKCPTDEYVKEALPFFIAVLALVAVLALFPSIVMFLPNLLF